MIKYLGSKRLLLPLIESALDDVELRLGPMRSALDLFSGTSRVGQRFKQRGLRVVANDHTAYAHAIATCFIEGDVDSAAAAAAEKLLPELQALPGRAGWFTQTYAHDARYLQPKNAARVEAIRDAIDERDVDDVTRAIVLTSLLDAADRVDSTVGVQMAYLKSWAKRSDNDLELRMPQLWPRAVHGAGRAVCGDAVDVVSDVCDNDAVDVVYLDPPYNQHSYLSNYHVWETLVRWDEPEVYGVAKKRVDCRERKSAFNSKRGIKAALEAVVAAVRCKALVVSFSNEGHISHDEMVQLLSTRGPVRVISQAHPRYVGAKIGIYNPKGDKVGSVSHLENTEYVFVVDVVA